MVDPRPRPPFAAILAEVLTPRLFEKWLTSLTTNQVAVEANRYSMGYYFLAGYLHARGLGNLSLLERQNSPLSYALMDNDTKETAPMDRWVLRYLEEAVITGGPFRRRCVEEIVPWLLEVLSAVAPQTRY